MLSPTKCQSRVGAKGIFSRYIHIYQKFLVNFLSTFRILMDVRVRLRREKIEKNITQFYKICASFCIYLYFFNLIWSDKLSIFYKLSTHLIQSNITQFYKICASFLRIYLYFLQNLCFLFFLI